METVITAVTLLAAGSVILAYAAFVRWRVKVHRVRDEAVQPPPAAPEPPAAPPTAPPVRSAEPVPATTAASRDAGRAVDLASAVEGIRLPDGLTPVVDVRPRPGTLDRAVFSAGGDDADALRTSIEAALAGVGFETSWTALQGLARRGPTTVAVAVVPEPHEAVVDGERGFPTTTAGQLVVDFWIPV